MSKTKPNILFIMTDQWSADAQDGTKESPWLKTPAVNQMAKDGVVFKQSYCTWPLCSPARASLFTGAMPHEHGLVGNVNCQSDAPYVPENMPTMGEVFKQAGYQTAYFGKDHTGGAAWRGCDEFGQIKFPQAGSSAEGAFFDPIFTRDTIEFLKQPHDKPFFCTLSLINPHDIGYRPGHCKCPPGYETVIDHFSMVEQLNKFTDDFKYMRGLDLPPVRPNWQDEPPAKLGKNKEQFKLWSERDWQIFIATYYGLIENTDWNIQLVMNTLREQGLEENTIVVFTSDHGDHHSAHGMNSKGTFYEENLRVPLIFQWKGTIENNRVNDKNPVSGCDLLPTLLDCAGINIPKTVSGKSLRPLLKGKTDDWREEIFAENNTAIMLRFGPWKYGISGDSLQHEFLFNLEDNPLETNDLAEDTNSTSILEECRIRMEQHTGDKVAFLENMQAEFKRNKELDKAGRPSAASTFPTMV